MAKERSQYRIEIQSFFRPSKNLLAITLRCKIIIYPHSPSKETNHTTNQLWLTHIPFSQEPNFFTSKAMAFVVNPLKI